MTDPPIFPSKPLSSATKNNENLDKPTRQFNLEQCTTQTNQDLEESVQETNSKYTTKTNQNLEELVQETSSQRTKPSLVPDKTLSLSFSPSLHRSFERYLNKDLITEILKNRCPSTIFKCSLVSKDWFQVVNDENFKKIQYKNSCENIQANTRLLWSIPQQQSLAETDIFLDQIPRSIEFETQDGFATDFVGSANGLICVLIHKQQFEEPISEEFLIMNPALKNGPTRKIQSMFTNETNENMKAFGFLFDDKTRTYHIACMEQNSENTGCSMFTFKCNENDWDSIGLLPYTIYALSTVGTTLNSSLYWLMSKYKGEVYDDLALQNPVLLELNLPSKGHTEIFCPNMATPNNFGCFAYLFNIKGRLNIAQIIPQKQLIWYTYQDSCWKRTTKISLPLGISQALSLSLTSTESMLQTLLRICIR